MTAADDKRMSTVETECALLKQSMESSNTTMTEIKKQLDDLPDEIVKRIDEKVDLKIDNRVQALETTIERDKNETQRWIIGLTIGMVTSLIAAVASLVMYIITKGGN